MRRRIQVVVLVAAVALAMTAGARTAEAQRRGRGHVVVVGGGLGYYSPFFYDPFWYGFYPWYPSPWYGYYPPYYYQGYGYRDRGPRGGELRLEIKPKETQVYVDGYYSGVVDDYDGVFQRLHLRPGDHELVLYLQGYKTVKQALRIRPGEDSKVRYDMVPLKAGEANEPPPAPPARAQSGDEYAPGAERIPPPRRPRTGAPPDAPEPPLPPDRPLPPQPPQPPDRPGAPEVRGERGAGFGAVAIRVQPADAEVYIDGERWRSPETGERLVVQLAEGTHRIEIRKDGYAPFTTDVRVREGEQMPLNVSLPRQ